MSDPTVSRSSLEGIPGPDEQPRAEGPRSAEDGCSFDVKLEQYAGPLDLLLDLIRRQKINIHDIPIAKITKQYLDYLRNAKELNVDLGGEFVFMAATLIQIKSKMLLPHDPTLPEAEQEDPREQLIQQLLEHEKFVQAAQMLQQKRLVGRERLGRTRRWRLFSTKPMSRAWPSLSSIWSTPFRACLKGPRTAPVSTYRVGMSR